MGKPHILALASCSCQGRTIRLSVRSVFSLMIVVFFIAVHSMCYRFIWIGSETEQFELEPPALDEWANQARAVAVKSLPQLASQRQVVCVKQGDEEDWFWNYFVNG